MSKAASALLALLCTLAALLSIAGSTPAAAEGADVRIASTSFALREQPTVRFSGYDSSADCFSIEVDGPRGYRETRSVYVSPGSIDETVTFPRITEPGEYIVDLFDRCGTSGGYLDGVTVSVDPALRVRALKANRATFYPTVRDGYQDDVKVNYRLNERARVRLEVRNSSGRMVKVLRDGVHRQGAVWWNGTDEQGDRVGVGRYRLTVVAEAGAARATRSTSVRAVSDIVTRHRSIVKTGREFSSRQKRGSCYIYRYSYPERAVIDCWGFFGASAYGQLRYGFRLPEGARDVRWRIQGHQACCHEGLLRQRLVRNGARSAAVVVEAGGTRNYTVRRVSLRYAYDVRR